MYKEQTQKKFSFFGLKSSARSSTPRDHFPTEPCELSQGVEKSPPSRLGELFSGRQSRQSKFSNSSRTETTHKTAKNAILVAENRKLKAQLVSMQVELDKEKAERLFWKEKVLELQGRMDELLRERALKKEARKVSQDDTKRKSQRQWNFQNSIKDISFF